MAWYDSDWLYRQQITIDKTKVPATQTNIPVLIGITTAANSVFGHAQSDGDDILFTNSADTKLDHDLVVYSDK